MEESEMLEVVLAAVFVTMAIVTVGSKTIPSAGASHISPLAAIGDGSDLPCPWCRAQTKAGDMHCPSCGHRFG
jgi:hypothetical protein